MKATVIILNSRERKSIRQAIERQFGITTLPDKVFFCLNKKERVYIAERSVFEVEQEPLNVKAFGLYFGTFMKDGFRLSLEGVQLLFDQCSKNLLPLSEKQKIQWFKGYDVTGISEILADDYYILTFDNIPVGVGKKKQDLIMNYLPKSRRITNIFS